MTSALTKIWEFLSQPPLSPEATLLLNAVMFLIFALLPFWLVAYGRLRKRGRRLK